MADQGPRKHKTVAELIALLSAFPPDTPVAKCADEFGTCWDLAPEMRTLMWTEHGWDWRPHWVDEDYCGRGPNGTETDHVIL